MAKPKKKSSQVPRITGPAPVREEFEVFSTIDPQTKKKVFKSRCKHCDQVMRGQNVTNLEGHLARAHEDISAKVQGMTSTSIHQFSAVLMIHFPALKDTLREREVAASRVEVRHELSDLLYPDPAGKEVNTGVPAEGDSTDSGDSVPTEAGAPGLVGWVEGVSGKGLGRKRKVSNILWLIDTRMIICTYADF